MEENTVGLFSKKEYKGILLWVNLKNEGSPEKSFGTKIPGGRLIAIHETGPGVKTGSGVTFIPDPEHRWDGRSK